MHFTTRLRVSFGDTDPAGLVYYPNLFHYCHIAMERFFAARCGITYSDLISRERLGFPTVRVKAEFFKPLIYGDEVDLTIAVKAIGRTSVTLEYELTRVADHFVCALIEQVHVCMNLENKTSVEF